MTSLTRDKLFALKPKAQKHEIEGFGTVYIKPLTELMRSRRMSEIVNEKGKPDKSTQEKRRANMIIDQICDEKGDPMFEPADIKEILELDGAKLDTLVHAIFDFNAEDEKKE